MYSIRTLLLLMTLLVSRPSVVAQVPILGEKIELYSKFLQEEQEICLNLPYHSCEYDLPNYAQNAQIWNDSLRQLLDSNTAYSFHFYPQKRITIWCPMPFLMEFWPCIQIGNLIFRPTPARWKNESLGWALFSNPFYSSEPVITFTGTIARMAAIGNDE